MKLRAILFEEAEELSEKEIEALLKKYPFAAAAYGEFIDSAYATEALTDLRKESTIRTGDGQELYSQIQDIAFDYEYSFLDNLEDINDSIKSIIGDNPNNSISESCLTESDIHEEKGFEFDTTWGSFTIGDEVKLSDEGKENDNYEDWINSTMIITWVDLEDDGMGKKEPIMSFEDSKGKAIPFSLYGYEIERV
jgi:hypothetical protein